MTWRDRLRTILATDQVAHDLIDHAHPFVLAHETDADGVICRCGQRWFSCGCAAELPLVDPPWTGWPRYLWRVKKEEMQRG